MKNVTHEGTLKIGNANIPCYVTDEGQRLLASRRLQVILKITEETTSSGRQVPGKRMDRFFSQKSLKPLLNRISDRTLLEPVKVKRKGKNIVGYDAKLLPEICRTMLEGRREDLLVGTRQLIIAEQCEILQSGFAQVGIIALIDEATGYQYDRTRYALEEILDKFISKELRKWAKTFPDEFYEQMFKLRNWQYIPFSVKRPGVLGKFTNDLVYERLAPGVLEELKRLTPRDEKGRTKHRYFQRLTEDVGHPRLREHLSAVIALMRASTKWDQFYRMLQRALPKYMEQTSLNLDYPEDMD